ncbi:MAG: hypothetical protein QOJ56_2069 [Mycobacterium sp.]|nr:hypothetical protein [Mycobacterium sp.]
MVATGINPARALCAATATAAELLGREDIGVLEPGRVADFVAMPGDPIADIGRTAEVYSVMRSGNLRRIPGDSSAPPHNDSIWPDDTQRAAVTLALAAATNSDMQFHDVIDSITDALNSGRPLQFVMELIRLLTAGLGANHRSAVR